MKHLHKIWAPAVALVLLSSCVGSKKYKTLQSDHAALNNKFSMLQNDLKQCEDDKLKLGSRYNSLQQMSDNQKQQIANLKEQSEFLKNNSTQIMGRLQDMSVLSDKQAESVKKSLESLAERDEYIKDLQTAMARKDSLNMALVMNLKGALSDVNEDIDIKVEKGVVFISISDKLLFSTGKYDVTPKAQTVLGKVAQVLKNQPNIEFMVEGHTDNVPIKGGAIRDNWDLSVLRATSVVRILQNQYGMDPKRMTAGGRGQYFPVDGNETTTGRAANRRTRIVILPQLDQFFQLLNPNTKAEAPAK